MEVFAPALVLSVVTLTLGATFILRGPLGKALAERSAGHERLDSTERMVSHQQDAGRLKEGS